MSEPRLVKIICKCGRPFSSMIDEKNILPSGKLTYRPMCKVCRLVKEHESRGKSVAALHARHTVAMQATSNIKVFSDEEKLAFERGHDGLSLSKRAKKGQKAK